MQEKAELIDFYANILWNYHYLNQEIQPCDIIIGLGSYDIRVAEHCAELWKRGFSKIIIFSGSYGNWTLNSFNEPEAILFKKAAIKKNIPETSIITETQSTNIGENILFSKMLIEQMKVSVNRVLIVTKPNTERRAYATAKKILTEFEIIISSPQISYFDQPTCYHSKEDLINEMVGDLDRIRTYPLIGYQIPQEIPKDVLDSFHQLINCGYSNHLL